MRVRAKPSLASSALKGLKAVSSCRTPRLEPFVAIANKKLGTSVQAINAQIAALQARADAIRMQEVGEVLAEPRDAVAHNGLAAVDLTLAASAPRAVNAAKGGKPGRIPNREPGAKTAGKPLRAAKSTRAAGCSTGCHQAKMQEPLTAGEVPSLASRRSRCCTGYLPAPADTDYPPAPVVLLSRNSDFCLPSGVTGVQHRLLVHTIPGFLTHLAPTSRSRLGAAAQDRRSSGGFVHKRTHAARQNR